LRNQQIAMTHSLAIRLNPANPDHHLWNNNGTWWCRYTVHPTPLTKQRIRSSLATKDLTEARLRRDQLLLRGRPVPDAERRKIVNSVLDFPDRTMPPP
jgi:hypothetical protein